MPKPSKTTRECLNCFDTYDRTESTASKSPDQFCSDLCEKEFNNTRVEENKNFDEILKDEPTALTRSNIYNNQIPSASSDSKTVEEVAENLLRDINIKFGNRS